MMKKCIGFLFVAALVGRRCLYRGAIRNLLVKNGVLRRVGDSHGVGRHRHTR